MNSASDPLLRAFEEAVAGRYSLKRELGRGGMGIVYLARDVRLDRSVAIKLLPPEFAAHAKLRERFLREARTAARLSHPYIVPIHSVDEIGDFVFYVMTFVDGETLAQRVSSRGPLPPSEATRVLREVAWALAYAHTQGVVHRDVKPANILLERGSERAMVTDFGIARLVRGSGDSGAEELLGTPEYMSPEQATGEAVDARSDIYSLGVVGFFAVTGALPFTAPTAQAVLAKHVTQPAPTLGDVALTLPRALVSGIDRCLVKDPADRFQNGRQLADALAPVLEKREDVPVPISAFLDSHLAVVALAIPATMIPIATLAIRELARFGPSLPPIVELVLLALGIVGVPLLIVANRLRPLLRLGYGPDDIAAALRSMHERKREQYLFEHGSHRTMRERVVGTLAAAGLATAGVVFAASIGHWVPEWLARWMPGWLPITAFITVLPIALVYRWARLRRGGTSFWADRWSGRWGRVVARVAGIRLGDREIAPAGRTENTIAVSAKALFDELPAESRKALLDVPETINDLGGQARVIRKYIQGLDDTLREALMGPARTLTPAQRGALLTQLRNARSAAEHRLTDVLTALETLRLDLIRLRAGGVSAQSITADLESARALGEDVDRLLAGEAEVDEMLHRSEHEPSPV